MQSSTYIQAIITDLERIAAVGDAQTARAAQVLAVALESSLARRLQEALTEAALDLSAQIDGGRIEVRVAADDLELVYVEDADDRPTETTDETSAARITLRLPESLKFRIESAAATAGVSVNTWLVHTLGRALEPRSTISGGRRRLTGYGRT